MAGRVFKRGQTYHIAFNYKGTEYRKSALTDRKREAENLLAFYLGQCARGAFKGFERETKAYTMAEMFDDLIRDCEQRQLRSIDTVKRRLKPLYAAEHISRLYQWAKRLRIPMTHLIDGFLTHGIVRLEVGVENISEPAAHHFAKRRHLMRVIDWLRLRDGLVIEIATQDVPEKEQAAFAARLRTAFELADKHLEEEQLPIFVGPADAKFIRKHLQREI